MWRPTRARAAFEHWNSAAEWTRDNSVVDLTARHNAGHNTHTLQQGAEIHQLTLMKKREHNILRRKLGRKLNPEYTHLPLHTLSSPESRAAWGESDRTPENSAEKNSSSSMLTRRLRHSWRTTNFCTTGAPQCGELKSNSVFLTKHAQSSNSRLSQLSSPSISSRQRLPYAGEFSSGNNVAASLFPETQTHHTRRSLLELVYCFAAFSEAEAGSVCSNSEANFRPVSSVRGLVTLLWDDVTRAWTLRALRRSASGKLCVEHKRARFLFSNDD